MHIRKFLSGIFEKVEFTLRFLGVDSRPYARIRDGYIALKERAQPFSKIPLIFCVWSAGRERSYGMEKPIDFWLRKGKAGGEPKPTETNAGKADVRRYIFFCIHANL